MSGPTTGDGLRTYNGSVMGVKTQTMGARAKRLHGPTPISDEQSPPWTGVHEIRKTHSPPYGAA